MKQILIIGAFLLLIGAAAIQVGWRREVSAGKGKHLHDAVPSQLVGWTEQDIPLGPNEAARGAVEKTLHYDDVFNREYRSARGVVSVYIAYWGPGSMPTQLVASHTPDRCWVENGWHCDEVKHHETLAGRTMVLRAGEWRIFTAPDKQKLQVQFWHMVGDETYDYGDRVNRVPSAWRWCRDAARQVFRSPPEQYFIRVTSDRPFAELAGDPGWEVLLGKLAVLGARNQESERQPRGQ